jgi:ribonuclease T1
VSAWAARRTGIGPASLLVLVLALALAGGAIAEPRHATDQAQPIIQVRDLPREARDTLALIKQGGPFPYKRDGVVFGNRERRLPSRPSGYYREYTVPTPGVRDRGARRIVAGTGGELYYTDDHYNTFRRIRE